MSSIDPVRLTVARPISATDTRNGDQFWIRPTTDRVLALVAGDIDEQTDPDWVVAYYGKCRFVLPNDDVVVLD